MLNPCSGSWLLLELSNSLLRGWASTGLEEELSNSLLRGGAFTGLEEELSVDYSPLVQ